MIWSSIDPGVMYFAEAIWDGRTCVDLAMWPLECLDMGTKGEFAVIEKPQVYRSGGARPSDILDLAMSAAKVSTRFRDVQWYLPREWKGQVPERAHQKRIKAQLTQNELLLLYGRPLRDQVHLIDAMGLGLYDLSRKGLR